MFCIIQVVATCRNPDSHNNGLHEIASDHSSRLSIVQLDVLNEGSINAAAQSVEKTHGRVDLLINTAGILHSQDAPTLPERSLSNLQVSRMP